MHAPAIFQALIIDFLRDLLNKYVFVYLERHPHLFLNLGGTYPPFTDYVHVQYDISIQELLVVKLAVEEWHHWFEGTREPFLVWTDHKNLEYICSDKRLNSRQA